VYTLPAEVWETQENKIESLKDNNYSKYFEVYSNLAEQWWHNQEIIALAWPETVIEISRIFTWKAYTIVMKE